VTLRGRLLTYSLIQVLALGLLPFAAGLFIRGRVLPILDEHLGRKTEATVLSLASRLDVALGSGEPELAEAALAELTGDPDLVRAEVRDRAGNLVASIGTGVSRALVSQPTARVQDLGDALAATAPIEMEGYPLGFAAAVFSKERQRSLIAWMMALAAAVALATLVAVIAAFRFSRRFVAPIHRMIQFSQRLKEGGLSERVASVAREGELARLAADLNAMAEALENRDAALAQRGRELEESLGKLRATQEELLSSTRLASVGEMAGRTAHEVLNPMTGINGRLTKMIHYEADAMEPNLDTLREIVGAWREAYRAGGLDGLGRSLAQPTADGGLLIGEDLDNLEGITAYLADSHRDRAADLQFLLKESDRVVHIVDGMRSLTRSAGTPVRARVDELLRESIETVADSAAQRKVALQLELDAAPGAEVRVDRYEFVQVLTNLLRNALLAIEEKSGRAGGCVTIASGASADRVEVRVRDDGCGILDEHVPLLFEASFTTRSSRDGTGLGLSIARRLARGFGGELRLERTAAGQGATFLLELPLAGPTTGSMDGLTHAQ
jgi:signal transduction histidine kinase